MEKKQFRNGAFLLIAAVLIYSFKGNPSWVELCSGLAFFLFGMQCMTDGLQQLAGGKLEKLLAKSTAKRWKGVLFGVASTMILQSTTIVSLLIIAFISASLITLSGGLLIMLGAYLGSSSGVWLLALAGQSVSLAPFAYPLLVIGVLASFNGSKSKALGRVVIGIAFIFLAIVHMKEGFSNFTTDFDLTQFNVIGWQRFLILIGVGFFATMVLQSSHATIMLVLTALGLAQITLDDGFILAIGAIWGSTVTTAIIGFIGGSRSGKRLALAHILFNFSTGALALLLLKPLTLAVYYIGEHFDLNPLIQLAVFHTLFNALGVTIFWQLQTKLVAGLERIIPDEVKEHIITETAETVRKPVEDEKIIEPKYLMEQSLAIPAAAMGAVFKEIRHLGEVSGEVLCLSLNIPLEGVTAYEFNEEQFIESHSLASVDANQLYNRYVKGLYGDILIYMSRIDFSNSDDADYYQDYLLNCQMMALSVVDAVKSGRHLQKNFNRYLQNGNSLMSGFYQELKRFLFINIRELYVIHKTLEDDLLDPVKRAEHLDNINDLLEKTKQFERVVRREIFVAGSQEELNAYQTSSVMNDLSYCRRLVKVLFKILIFTIESQAYPFANDDKHTSESDAEPVEEAVLEDHVEDVEYNPNKTGAALDN